MPYTLQLICVHLHEMYIGRIKQGIHIFDGTPVAEGTWYFSKGGAFQVSGAPTVAELSAAISAPVHACGDDLYLGGDMPEACCWEKASDFGTATGVAAFAVVALAAFLGISREITHQTGLLEVRYGGIIKDVGIVMAAQIIWNEIITQAAHPFTAVIIDLTLYHWTMFFTATVASGIVAAVFNASASTNIYLCMITVDNIHHDVRHLPGGRAVLGRAAFEILCLLTVGLVSPIMPAPAFSSILQLATGFGIAAISARDATEASCRGLTLGEQVATDALLLGSFASSCFLAMPFCTDTFAVPVGLEIGVAVALIFQVSCAGSVFAFRQQRINSDGGGWG